MKKINQLFKSVLASFKTNKKRRSNSTPQTSTAKSRRFRGHYQTLQFDDYGNPLFI